MLSREQIWEDFVSCLVKIYCSVFHNIFNINKSGIIQVYVCYILIKIYFEKGH